MNKLTKDQVTRLSTTDSIKESNETISAIEERTSYVIKTMVSSFFSKSNDRYWWAWEYYENDSPEPSFDVKDNVRNGCLSYSLNDCSSMVFIDKNGNEWDLLDSFPLRWLWEDFETELTDGIKKYRQEAESKKEAAKNRAKQLKELKQQYVKAAMTKLTQEELWATGLSRKMPKTLKKLQLDGVKE